jgi:hypothetical protein
MISPWRAANAVTSSELVVINVLGTAKPWAAMIAGWYGFEPLVAIASAGLTTRATVTSRKADMI